MCLSQPPCFLSLVLQCLLFIKLLDYGFLKLFYLFKGVWPCCLSSYFHINVFFLFSSELAAAQYFPQCSWWMVWCGASGASDHQGPQFHYHLFNSISVSWRLFSPVQRIEHHQDWVSCQSLCLLLLSWGRLFTRGKLQLCLWSQCLLTLLPFIFLWTAAHHYHRYWCVRD